MECRERYIHNCQHSCHPTKRPVRANDFAREDTLSPKHHGFPTPGKVFHQSSKKMRARRGCRSIQNGTQKEIVVFFIFHTWSPAGVQLYFIDHKTSSDQFNCVINMKMTWSASSEIGIVHIQGRIFSVGRSCATVILLGCYNFPGSSPHLDIHSERFQLSPQEYRSRKITYSDFATAYPSGVRKAAVLNLFISTRPFLNNSFNAASVSFRDKPAATSISFTSMIPGGPLRLHYPANITSIRSWSALGMRNIHYLASSTTICYRASA